MDQRCSGLLESWNPGPMRSLESGAPIPPPRECCGSAASENICGNDVAVAFRVRGEIRSSNSFPCFRLWRLQATEGDRGQRDQQRLCEIFHKRSSYTTNFPASNLVSSYLVSISSAATVVLPAAEISALAERAHHPDSLRILPALPALFLADRPSHGYHSFGCNFVYPASKKGRRERSDRWQR